MSKYLFTSERLGFRKWEKSDLEPFSAMCADPEVMKYFPGVLTKEECSQFITRMNAMQAEKGYCYFAVDTLADREFIGFIGLKWQTSDVLDHPFLDIGWRIGKDFWGRGYASEGAERCLQWAFQNTNEENIYATAAVENKASIRVMEKIGMHYWREFSDPVFAGHPEYDKVVVYSIKR